MPRLGMEVESVTDGPHAGAERYSAPPRILPARISLTENPGRRFALPRRVGASRGADRLGFRLRIDFGGALAGGDFLVALQAPVEERADDALEVGSVVDLPHVVLQHAA